MKKEMEEERKNKKKGIFILYLFQLFFVVYLIMLSIFQIVTCRQAEHVLGR